MQQMAQGSVRCYSRQKLVCKGNDIRNLGSAKKLVERSDSLLYSNNAMKDIYCR